LHAVLKGPEAEERTGLQSPASYKEKRNATKLGHLESRRKKGKEEKTGLNLGERKVSKRKRDRLRFFSLLKTEEE